MKERIVQKLKRLLGDKDERNLLLHIALAFGVKGLALLVSFFSMPLYIKYFGNDEALGLWYTILSLLSWVQICDLGLGNGLRNRLTEASCPCSRGTLKALLPSRTCQSLSACHSCSGNS